MIFYLLLDLGIKKMINNQINFCLKIKNQEHKHRKKG